jgi:hypothetical protein
MAEAMFAYSGTTGVKKAKSIKAFATFAGSGVSLRQRGEAQSAKNFWDVKPDDSNHARLRTDALRPGFPSVILARAAWTRPDPGAGRLWLY